VLREVFANNLFLLSLIELELRYGSVIARLELDWVVLPSLWRGFSYFTVGGTNRFFIYIGLSNGAEIPYPGRRAQILHSGRLGSGHGSG